MAKRTKRPVLAPGRRARAALCSVCATDCSASAEKPLSSVDSRHDCTNISSTVHHGIFHQHQQPTAHLSTVGQPNPRGDCPRRTAPGNQAPLGPRAVARISRQSEHHRPGLPGTGAGGIRRQPTRPGRVCRAAAPRADPCGPRSAAWGIARSIPDAGRASGLFRGRSARRSSTNGPGNSNGNRWAASSSERPLCPISSSRRSLRGS